MSDFDQMRRDCHRLRSEIVDAIHRARSGHTGGSLSCVEIVWTLYSGILRYRPDESDWPDRDRFILSKGHAAPTLYHVLADKGYYDKALLADFRQAGSRFQGHPDMNRVPGVEISAGSLGMGISVGVGMCLAARLDKRDFRVYVLCGDGELQEGQCWEAMTAASKWSLDNLVVIVDRNRVQLDGPTAEIMPVGDVPAKMAAFGFDVLTCDGHDCEAIHDALRQASQPGAAPRAVVCDTVKGKGVSFMEGEHIWHGKQIGDEEYKIAKRDLAALQAKSE
jgi:transketolase